MERARPLHIESGVILGQHVLAVGLFTHLDVGDWIVAVLQVSNLGDSVIGSVVQKRDRNHGGQSAGDAAGKEKVKSHLGLARGAEVRRLMPRIDGRAIGSRLLLIGGVAQSIVKGVVESSVVSGGS